jgi:hypothetical protein
MATGYSRRMSEEQEEANEIVAGRRPAQAKEGVMTPAERRASIARAFGAKDRPPIPTEQMKRAAEKRAMLERDADELQRILGKDVTVVPEYKKGGQVKAKSKPKTSSASKRGDGIAQRGKTKGRFV